MNVGYTNYYFKYRDKNSKPMIDPLKLQKAERLKISKLCREMISMLTKLPTLLSLQ